MVEVKHQEIKDGRAIRVGIICLKQKEEEGKQVEVGERGDNLVNIVPVMLLVLGTILMLDGLVFHWFGDLFWLDQYIHHWHLGLLLIVFALFFTVTRRKKR